MKLFSAMLLAIPLLLCESSASAQTTNYPSFKADYQIQRLNPNGGTLLSNFYYALEYSATLAYPAGANNVIAQLIQGPSELPVPPGMNEVHLTMLFSAAGQQRFIFKGTSVLKVAVPNSIPNGTVLLLTLWSVDSNETRHFGATYRASVANSAVSFPMENLAMPPIGNLGLTLGA